MNRKIRILHISKYYPPYIGGLESFCHDIVTALASTNQYEQKVFCYNDCPSTIIDKTDGIDVVRVGIQTIIFSQPLAKEYGKLLKETIDSFKPDIIHFLYPNPYAAYFFLKYDYKGVLHLDWICDIVKQKITRIFFESQTKKLLNKADFVTSITPTYFENTDFLPKYHGEKGFIACRIGDARTKITEEQKNKSRRIKEQFANKKIVFFFGRHTEYKGLKYLIEANKFLDQTKIEIIIAGKGELTKKLMKQSKKYSNIKFVGRLSDNDINSYLLACDIFAFPSITRNEAFGISLAEAMYFGKPACTFTIPGSGVNWVSINGQTCLEAQNKNVLQFANNITKLSNDSKLYATLSINSKKGAILCLQKTNLILMLFRSIVKLLQNILKNLIIYKSFINLLLIIA